MVCRVRIIITDGTTADCTQAWQLISGIAAEYLLADKGYDKDLYKLRHLVENAFLHLKRWRGTASRYAKNVRSFLAALKIRCIALWANIS
ncbi:transposase [Holospora obtusa F1]|uniref:Transposase n=1 Tax=Holospora obtusa F1 TaxID=1399147 RepID=W6TDT4_HOLOB|nr:transposase [Holospora obtusa F1]